MTDREAWLNGWPRHDDADTVLIGSGVHCAGCGHFMGITTVAIEAGYVAPTKLPDWPFNESSCPLCAMRPRLWEPEPVDRLAERAIRYKKAAKPQ
jgi:hypothetical protein